jgi:hypothetical protein
LVHFVSGRPGTIYESGWSQDGIDLTHAGAARSIDFGATWQGFDLPQSGFGNSAYRICPEPAAEQTIYVWLASDDHDLARSDDAGRTFVPLLTGFHVADAKVIPGLPHMLFALDYASNGGVKLSSDGGETWESRSSGLPTGTGLALFLDASNFSPSNPDEVHLVAIFRTAGAYRSTNGGLSWTAIPLSGLGASTVIAADWDPETGRLFLATNNDGVYISGLGFVNDGLSTRGLTSVAYDATTSSVVLGTDHASVRTLPLNEIVAAPMVAQESAKLSLRAVPNPFTSKVQLDMVLPADAQRIDLSIYTVDGRRVIRLVSGMPAEGSRTASWDGRDSAGRRLVSGVYFARLDCDDRTVTQRMVLLGE